MERSVAYLPLLATSPFFTHFSRAQLLWVLDHSQEWLADTGAEISTSDYAPDNFWILLDGSWQVEYNGKLYKAGYGDPGKWYGGEQFAQLNVQTRLLACVDSYVLSIQLAALEEMQKLKFPFGHHFHDGMRYYRHILNTDIRQAKYVSIGA